MKMPVGEDVASAGISRHTPSLDFPSSIQVIQQAFIKEARACIPQLRTRLQGLGRTNEKQQLLRELEEQLSFFRTSSQLGMPRIAVLASAIENLIGALKSPPSSSMEQLMRTAAFGLDRLALLVNDTNGKKELPWSPLAMVVDDEPMCSFASSSALETVAIRSIQVNDSAQALQLIQRNTFDIIVTDLNMPHLDGHEFCKRLRAMPAYAKTPIIFVTGEHGVVPKALSTLAGASDFITKPFSIYDLSLRAVSSVLSN